MRAGGAVLGSGMPAPVREELEEIAHNGETMRAQQDLARPGYNRPFEIMHD